MFNYQIVLLITAGVLMTSGLNLKNIDEKSLVIDPALIKEVMQNLSEFTCTPWPECDIDRQTNIDDSQESFFELIGTPLFFGNSPGEQNQRRNLTSKE
jgi:hypothetical protein